jgi:hypothetical protein
MEPDAEPEQEMKPRMISFRVSAAEYEQAERQCHRIGIRSVSGLAHIAFLGSLNNEPDDKALLSRRIGRLERQVRQILVSLSKPSAKKLNANRRK